MNILGLRDVHENYFKAAVTTVRVARLDFRINPLSSAFR